MYSRRSQNMMEIVDSHITSLKLFFPPVISTFRLTKIFGFTLSLLSRHMTETDKNNIFTEHFFVHGVLSCLKKLSCSHVIYSYLLSEHFSDCRKKSKRLYWKLMRCLTANKKTQRYFHWTVHAGMKEATEKQTNFVFSQRERCKETTDKSNVRFKYRNLPTLKKKKTHVSYIYRDVRYSSQHFASFQIFFLSSRSTKTAP